jgi:hypothetical protein
MFRDSLLKLNFLCVFMTSLADDLNVATVSMPVLHVCKAVHAMRRMITEAGRTAKRT